jgi:hypothetical protein
MVRLVTYRCSKHGDVPATSEYGPCLQCEQDKRAARIEAAKQHILRYSEKDPVVVLITEIAVIRELLFRAGRVSEVAYYESVAMSLDKATGNDLATFARKHVDEQ